MSDLPRPGFLRRVLASRSGNPPEDRALWGIVALHLLPGLGLAAKLHALARFGDPAEVALRVPARDLLALPRVRPGGVDEAVAARRRLAGRVDEEIGRARRLGVRIVVRGSPEYPAALETIAVPPLLLYVRGSLPEGVVRIAVVGSRRASAYGRRIATGLGSALASRGVEVVSGGARGIDTRAHVGALEAGGRTVAVLGSGFARPYPVENEELFERVAGSGAVVSEFATGVDPHPGNFPRRNRIISGLAAAVVVVEAARRSGSLSTAAHALEQGREVMAVPGPVSSDLSEGCHRLIQQGAKLVHAAEDLFEELSPMYASALLPAPPPTGDGPPRAGDLHPDEVAVLALFDDPEPVHVDRLAEMAPFGIARLHAALLALEVRGSVEQLTGGYYLGPPRKGS